MRIPKTLILSSTVASSRVGASAASFCLQRLGIETVVLPTTILGRHPGWGNPGGAAVENDILKDVWAGVKAQDIRFDAVLTGYMGTDEHIPLGVEIIEHVKSTNPNALIAVDPVMGDHGRLYIPESRAEAIINHLIPLADFITPNFWEMDYIQNQNSRFAARLITSVPDEENIGAVWEDGAERWQVSHTKFETVPHGGGDSLAGMQAFINDAIPLELKSCPLSLFTASCLPNSTRYAALLRTITMPMMNWDFSSVLCSAGRL